VRAGCSGDNCVEKNSPASGMMTHCMYTEVAACLDDHKAVCERQADGDCGFTRTPALSACLKRVTPPFNGKLVVRFDDGPNAPGILYFDQDQFDHPPTHVIINGAMHPLRNVPPMKLPARAKVKLSNGQVIDVELLPGMNLGRSRGRSFTPQ
jgi:hypothetical protein